MIDRQNQSIQVELVDTQYEYPISLRHKKNNFQSDIVISEVVKVLKSCENQSQKAEKSTQPTPQNQKIIKFKTEQQQIDHRIEFNPQEYKICFQNKQQNSQYIKNQNAEQDTLPQKVPQFSSAYSRMVLKNTDRKKQNFINFMNQENLLERPQTTTNYRSNKRSTNNIAPMNLSQALSIDSYSNPNTRPKTQESLFNQRKFQSVNQTFNKQDQSLQNINIQNELLNSEQKNPQQKSIDEINLNKSTLEKSFSKSYDIPKNNINNRNEVQVIQLYSQDFSSQKSVSHKRVQSFNLYRSRAISNQRCTRELMRYGYLINRNNFNNKESLTLQVEKWHRQNKRQKENISSRNQQENQSKSINYDEKTSTLDKTDPLTNSKGILKKYYEIRQDNQFIPIENEKKYRQIQCRSADIKRRKVFNEKYWKESKKQIDLQKIDISLGPEKQPQLIKKQQIFVNSKDSILNMKTE